MSLKIAFTKYTSAHGFGKTVFRDSTGAVVSQAVVTMSDGLFETVHCDWAEFGGQLEALRPMEALSYGVCHKKNDRGHTITQGRLVTKRVEAMLGEENDFSCVSRSKSNFKWHEWPCDCNNVLFVDVDGLEADLATESDIVERECLKLLALYPELGRLPGGFWTRASAGANIYDAESGDLLKGLSGLHLYFCVPATIPFRSVLEYLDLRRWLNGSGYYKTIETKYGAACLERGAIDFAVFQPERFDFAGGAVCRAGSGLEQRLGPAQWFECDEAGAPDFNITEADRLLAERNRESARSEARSSVRRHNAGVARGLREDGSPLAGARLDRIVEGALPGALEIDFDNGERVPVWKLIFFPRDYAGKYCADPLFPEKGKQKATFYFNDGAERETMLIIASFAKGGRNYRLETDIDGVREMLKKIDPDIIKAGFKSDPRWITELASLNDVEQQEILELLKDRAVGTKAEFKTKVSHEKGLLFSLDNNELLQKVNEHFAYVTIEGKAVFAEERQDEIILRTEKDFLLEVADWPRIKTLTATGKETTVNVGKVWCSWSGRRRYAGIKFEPGEQAGEFELNGELYLNRFRGFRVRNVTPESRSCGMTECEGKGCLEFFYSRAEAEREPLCSKGGWTFWAKTVHEVACAGNLKHTKWVLDWFADMIQAPGGRVGKNGARKRSEVALCLRGGQGTGKDSIIEPILKILSPYTATVTDMARITHNFNSYMEDVLLLFANEAIWGGSRKEGNKLKDIITGDSLMIERKNINTYTARNWVRLFVASNSEWVVPAEDDERRYTVFNVTSQYKQNREWFAKVKSGIVDELYTDFMTWKVTRDVCVNLKTPALAEQKLFGRDLVDDFFMEAMGENWFWDDDGTGKYVTHRQLEELFQERYAGYRAYAETPESFKRRFRKRLNDKGAGLTAQIRINNKKYNGFRMPHYRWMLIQFPWLNPDGETPTEDLDETAVATVAAATTITPVDGKAVAS